MNLQKQLIKYADAIVRVGINIQKGDNVVVYSDTDSLPLLREVVRLCWAYGAQDVVTQITDKEIQKSYYVAGSDEVFDHYPDFKVDYAEALYKEEYHRIRLQAPTLDLFKDVDGDRLHRQNMVFNRKTEFLQTYFDKGTVKWVVAATASPYWAKQLYPELSEGEALNELWKNIFVACRIDCDDPVAAWRQHDEKLKRYENWLDEQGFSYLHYEAPGTDLKVYLAERNKWIGGSSVTPDGVSYIANMPTEEIFGTPHKSKVDGTLRATKPLSLDGKIIEDLSFVFENGKVVEFTASKNQDVLEKQMSIDEGAKYLGEVALVPHSSPVSRMNLIFGTTLFDENASCHFALGSSYAETIIDGATMSKEERAKLGANESMIHIDFMVGSHELNITGYKKDGTKVPVLVDGEFPKI